MFKWTVLEHVGPNLLGLCSYGLYVSMLALQVDYTASATPAAAAVPAAAGEKTLAQKQKDAARAAVGETVILLHPPLRQVCVSIRMEMGRQSNDTVADG